jgi:hypothetical protein
MRLRVSTMLVLLAALAGVGAGLCGCASQSYKDARASLGLPAPYRPDNVYAAQRTLPVKLRRVALLPLASDDRRTDLVEGRALLGTVLADQLIKTKRFEVVQVSPDGLQARTGRRTWSAEDVLPQDFFASLRELYDCDAVMFCQLTECRAYPPLAVGWRLKLVDARTLEILWAGDEYFDASRPEVVAAAKHYEGQAGWAGWFSGNSSDDWTVLHSPQKFGEYAAVELLGTLPGR